MRPVGCPPRLVAVPMMLPLKMGRLIGLAVGVMVELPTTITGALAEGKAMDEFNVAEALMDC